jgi:hypothetical protein
MGWFTWSSDNDPEIEPVWLGYSWTRTPAASGGDPNAPGSLDVYGVFVDSPLYKAGLTSGSGGLYPLSIVSVDGTNVSTAQDLIAFWPSKKPGDQVAVVTSDGKTYLVTLESPPNADELGTLRFMEEGSLLGEITDSFVDAAEAATGAVGQATSTLLLFGVLAAGAYWAFDRERARGK